MHIQFNFVQQCIQISTRINSSMYIHTSVFVSFETITTCRIQFNKGLLNPIFSTEYLSELFFVHSDFSSPPLLIVLHIHACKFCAFLYLSRKIRLNKLSFSCSVMFSSVFIYNKLISLDLPVRNY